MGPGFVFVSLFAVLIAIYALLSDTLGSTLTFILQAALVLVLLAAATWYRRMREASPPVGFDDILPTASRVAHEAVDEEYAETPMRRAS
jgi:hypothetical protein